MKKTSKHIILPCDCGCCMFVIEKTKWEDGDVSYNITVQDSRYDHDYNTIWGRVKHACRIFLGKPVYYNDVHIENQDAFQSLIEEMKSLFDSDI